MLRLRKILAAVDFSPCSEVAAKYAVDLAERVGASVTLVHGYEFPVQMPFPGAPPFLPSPDTMVEVAEGVTRQLEELASRIRRPEVAVSIARVEGPPKQMIPAFADRHDFDLIVVGTHGRTGLRHVLLGSVAEAVVRRAHRPVLTVHEPSEQTAQAAP